VVPAATTSDRLEDGAGLDPDGVIDDHQRVALGGLDDLEVLLDPVNDVSGRERPL